MKTFKRISLATFIALAAILVTGCTTANYGLTPESVQGQKDTFKFKIFMGGFSTVETTDKAVVGDLETYQKNNGYMNHKIISKRFNTIPTYYEYTVQFFRD